MVFANIYSRLNDIEQKVNSLSVGSSEGGVVSGGVVASGDPVDLTPLNNKVEALELKATELSAKFDTLPTSFVSQQEVNSSLEKINQLTGILAQFNVQLNSLLEKVNALTEQVNGIETTMAQA